MKNILKLITFSTIFTFTNCSTVNNVYNLKNDEKVNFILTTSERKNGPYIDVSISTCDAINETPIIDLNNEKPDTTINTTGNFCAIFKNVNSDSLIEYNISLRNHFAIGQFIIPGEIVSLFCNNRYLPSSNLDTIEINSSDVYTFTWSTKTKTDYFNINYYGSITNGDIKTIVTEDTTLQILPSATNYIPPNLNIIIESQIVKTIYLNQGSCLDVSYNICLPKYICHFYAVNKQIK